MTRAELEAAFMDPLVYVSSVYSFNHQSGKAGAYAQACAGNGFAAYGTAVAGSGDYGTNVYSPRCMALIKASNKRRWIQRQPSAGEQRRVQALTTSGPDGGARLLARNPPDLFFSHGTHSFARIGEANALPYAPDWRVGPQIAIPQQD